MGGGSGRVKLLLDLGFFQDGVWWEVGDSEGGVLGSVVSALGGALEECRVT